MSAGARPGSPRFVAARKPLADARGSERRVADRSTGARPRARPGGRARTRASAPLLGVGRGHYSLPAAPLAFTASARTPVAACLYTAAKLGCASNLSQVATASSLLPAESWEEASHTRYAGCGSAATAVCRSVMATSHFLRAMNNLPKPACASAISPFLKSAH